MAALAPPPSLVEQGQIAVDCGTAVYRTKERDFSVSGSLQNIGGQSIAAPISILVTGFRTDLEAQTGTSLVLSSPDGEIPSGQHFVVVLHEGTLAPGQSLPFLYHIQFSNPFSEVGTATLNQLVGRAYRQSGTVAEGFFQASCDVIRMPAGNHAPRAQAGPDRAVQTGSPVQLDGNGSTDPDGDPLSYRWSLISSPSGSAAQLDILDSPTAALTPDLPGDYVVALWVSDGYLESGVDTLKLVATDGTSQNFSPVITSAPTLGATDTRPYSYQVRATDGDNDPLEYELVEAPLGMVISSAGLIQWTPRMEPPHDTHTMMFTVVVRVSDGHGGTTEQRYRLSVMPCTCT